MSRKKDIDLDLTGFAELFMNDEGRAESRLPRIYDRNNLGGAIRKSPVKSRI